MDPICVAIGIGLVVSLLLTELFGLAAGGMVVPGYLALFLHKPVDIALTLTTALGTFFIVRGLARLIIIYGKRRTAMMLLVGFLLGALVRWLVAIPPDVAATLDPSEVHNFSVIGFVIPGLIAIWIERQGLIETVSVMFTGAAVVRLVLVVCGMELML
jgi:poly-gamma-glutamate biosynthesis protein PgsC/CapC